MLDFHDLLDEAPYRLPGRLVDEAARATGGAAALYVVDIGGALLRRIAGDDDLPATLPAPGALGPEIGADDAALLAQEVRRERPEAIIAPLWLRGRATSLLLAARGGQEALAEIARSAAPAVELAPGYTDVFDRARRERPATAAAEIQQDLLSPRRCTVAGARIAASLIPAYDVGGDWFDHAENPEGVWLGVADAMGRGLRAAAVSSVAIGALRAARRAGADLEGCCEAVDVAIDDMAVDSFVTLVLCTWQPSDGTLSWVNCGHPPPLLLSGDQVVELTGTATHPLGLWRHKRRGFERNQRTLSAGDRVLMYTDGVTDRRLRDGAMFGIDGLTELVETLGGLSAAETVQAIEAHLDSLSEDEPADDATQLVLGVVG